ncbi:MAG TPA: TetR family transcriptional regulator [Candidatus Dormibacteraeota bacterium]
MATEAGQRRGRPAGSPPNREAILAAAREQFAERGYDNATIRGIAARAGVDPALVHHYYGSKADLFAAALRMPLNPRDVLLDVLDGDVDTLGERLVRRFLDIWSAEAGGIGEAVLGMLRSATTHEAAARMVREFVSREALGRVAEALDVPQARLRAALAGSQLIGLALARYVVRVEPIASADVETLVACYAPTLQRYLAGPLPGDHPSKGS